MTWTRFMDMNSGGGQKEDWAYIYIEAGQKEAVVIFYNRFGHNPHRVTCACCGPDYSIDEDDTLEEASGYKRGCAWDDDEKKYIETSAGSEWRPYQTVEEHSEDGGVLVVPASEIKPDEQIGEIPEQGYVWVD